MGYAGNHYIRKSLSNIRTNKLFHVANIAIDTCFFLINLTGNSLFVLKVKLFFKKF